MTTLGAAAGLLIALAVLALAVFGARGHRLTTGWGFLIGLLSLTSAALRVIQLLRGAS